MSSKKYSILVTRKIPKIGIELLSDLCTIDHFDYNDVISREELEKRINNVDGIVCMLSEKMDKTILDIASRLKVISNFAVGFNNIDVSYASKKGIVVTNTPEVLTDATADFTWALLLAIVRRIGEGERMMRSGGFLGWEPLMLLGQDLKMKTLGIIGAGRIGTAVIQRSKGWDMKILYYDRTKNRQIEKDFGAQLVKLETLYEKSDFISLHVPLMDDTKYLIDEKALTMMKSTAYLINTSRGAVINETALVKALREQWIAGAALDVFELEPALTPGLEKLENVILTPHLGSATVNTRDEMARIASLNLLAVLEGKKPKHIVNPEVLTK
jgi:glyoxylate reductase